jgi:hypothetical protein
LGSKAHICKWKKNQYKEDLDKLRKLVQKPKYVCIGCGRAAKDKKLLCKPVEI